MSVNKNKLHHFIESWEMWKHEYHSDQMGNVIFQNKKLLTNVRFTSKSFHNVRNNLKGFEKIPDTIMHPSEVWSLWADPKKQTVVLRNYIKDGYIVQTKDGEVTNSFATENISKYRVGVILL